MVFTGKPELVAVMTMADREVVVVPSKMVIGISTKIEAPLSMIGAIEVCPSVWNSKFASIEAPLTCASMLKVFQMFTTAPSKTETWAVVTSIKSTAMGPDAATSPTKTPPSIRAG